MGVDCRVTLPPNVRLGHLRKVIGAVCGCPKTDAKLDKTGGVYARVDGVRAITTTVPEMVTIIIDRQTVDGQTGHHVNYHFESDEGGGTHAMLPPSTAFWIAVMRRVVTFFGGRLDYNDSDETDWDYEVPFKSDAENCPQNGEKWNDLNRRILAIEPITEEEWRGCDQYAAYKIDD